MAEPRNLFYYPRSPSAWLERTAGLSPLARAAFADLEGQAWTAPKRGAAPCSVPDDDAALARMARLELRDWKKVAAEVRGLLMYREGVLVDDQLLQVWKDQQTAYTKRATAGSTGGKAKALHKQSASNATALVQQLELESEGVVPPVPSGTGVEPSPAPGGALAPVGAALTGARTLYRPERDEQERLLDVAYAAKLRERADAWFADHVPETSDMRLDALTAIGVSVDDDLKPWQERAAYSAMLGSFRALKGLPDCDTWVAEVLAGTREWPAGVPRLELARA